MKKKLIEEAKKRVDEIVELSQQLPFKGNNDRYLIMYEADSSYPIVLMQDGWHPRRPSIIFGYGRLTKERVNEIIQAEEESGT